MLQVLHFPFPTTPDRDALAAAERTLSALGALDADGALTERGRAMAALPLDPRPSRMILQVCTSLWHTVSLEQEAHLTSKHGAIVMKDVIRAAPFMLQASTKLSTSRPRPMSGNRR